MTKKKRTIPAAARGKARVLRERGITFDAKGRARKEGRFLSAAALRRAFLAAARASTETKARAKRVAASTKTKTKTKTRRPPPKPTSRPPRKPQAAPSLAPRRPKKAATKKPAKLKKLPTAPPPSVLSRQQLAALEMLSPSGQKAALTALSKTGAGAKPTKTEKRAIAKLEQAAKENKQIRTAKDELRSAVRAAAKNSGRAYGYDPALRHHYKIKGAFAGYKITAFKKRAGYVQEHLKKKFPTSYYRDLHIQAVHIREYMTQGDGGSGRRAIIEKTLLAGRDCITNRLINRKTGKPLRVFQMYISRIRILVRKQDASMYNGYSTKPIGGKRSKAVTDIRGLEGFEEVRKGENPLVALDRLVERLENHLDDILDGLPVVYVKSLEIKFDTEAQ